MRKIFSSMFGWTKSRSPVDPEAKRWIESRLAWLIQQFGTDFMTDQEMVVPTDDFFPDAFDRSKPSVRKMLDRVCEYMCVDRRYVNLEFFNTPISPFLVDARGNDIPPGNAGTFDAYSGYCVISIADSQLDDPLELVGTLAHELAHYRLIGEQRVTGDEYDDELLTDLTVVFHCMGIFLGNCPRHWDSDYSCWPGTDLRKPEYMTMPMFAYALAHQAWWRDDPKPEWMTHMKSELRSCFKSSVRYLFETGDSTLSPDKFA